MLLNTRDVRIGNFFIFSALSCFLLFPKSIIYIQRLLQGKFEILRLIFLIILQPPSYYAISLLRIPYKQNNFNFR